MELAVPLPLSGRALVEIRRSRAVVIAPGESCFDYGPFSSILVRPNPVPGWRRRHLGNVGGRNVARWKGLISKYYI